MRLLDEEALVAELGAVCMMSSGRVARSDAETAAAFSPVSRQTRRQRFDQARVKIGSFSYGGKDDREQATAIRAREFAVDIALVDGAADSGAGR